MTEPSPPLLPAPRGAVRVARVFGIDVHVHWAWVIAVWALIALREGEYSSLSWNVVECLALFGIVVLHEFGHALACKSVNGQADHILLWPLGGVAYVRPPPRPGATLWVSSAGPLVNVVLIPFTLAAGFWSLGSSNEDLRKLVDFLWGINVAVLVFNVVPIYPLDGGKMLRSVLWFVIGPHRSLIVATGIGLLGGIAFMLWALTAGEMWLILIAVFMLTSSWSGFRLARARLAASRLPRRETHRCPSCGEPPPYGALWPCPACGAPFDAFENHATCPHCRNRSATVRCPYCGDAPEMGGWYAYEVR